MVPRTYLSLPFPYQRWDGTRYRGGLFGGFPGENYYRPAEGQPFNPDAHIPPNYWEQLALCDGLWDDGERLVLITWMNIVVYPSWDITATWWDRSSGGHRGRQEINFVIVPPTAAERAMRIEVSPEDPALEALGTEVDVDVAYTSPISPYVRGFSQARDGQIWSAQGGSINALCPVRLVSQAEVYASPRLSASSTQSMDARITALANAYAERDSESLTEYARAGSSRAEAIEAYTIGHAETRVLYPTFPPAPAPGVDIDPNAPGIQAPAPDNPEGVVAPSEQAEAARAQMQAASAATTPAERAALFVRLAEVAGAPQPGAIQAARDAMGNDAYLERADAYAGTVINAVTLVSEPRTLFLPGSGQDASAMYLIELDMFTAEAFAVVREKRALVSTTGTRGTVVPGVFYALADVEAGSWQPPAGAFIGGVGGVMTTPPVLRRLILLPQRPVAVAFDEQPNRAWALLADNTACCFDYDTGEVFAYFWLPLPYAVATIAVATKIAWQRNYRRLLVFGVLPSKDPTVTRNAYDSRIVGYSTTPLPVHVCKPIPLRPVRAGQPTPFLIRQVGSLGEPIAGLATLEPGAGVTVDRTLVPLDDTGEAHVLVTAGAEGTGSLTARIAPHATWDQPAAEVPFNAVTYSVGRGESVVSNGPWIEGLA